MWIAIKGGFVGGAVSTLLSYVLFAVVSLAGLSQVFFAVPVYGFPIGAFIGAIFAVARSENRPPDQMTGCFWGLTGGCIASCFGVIGFVVFLIYVLAPIMGWKLW